MFTIEAWANFYIEKRLWVYPHNLEEKDLYYWKNIKSNDEYNELFKQWNWNNSTGIKLVVGKKGVRIVEVSTEKLLKKVLFLLGLPNDYSWIIYRKPGYSIIVDTPSVSLSTKGIVNKDYKHVSMLWDGYYMLPSTNIPRYFYKNRIPTGHPQQIPDDMFLKCITELSMR